MAITKSTRKTALKASPRKAAKSRVSKTQKHLAIAAATACSAAILFHSGEFWAGVAGEKTGWLLAATIELSALVLLSSTRTFRYGVLAALLALLAPIAEVSTPQVKEMYLQASAASNAVLESEAQKQRTETLAVQIELQRDMLGTGLGPQAKLAVVETLGDLQQQYTQAQKENIQATRQSAQGAPQALTWFKAVAHAIGLILLAFGSINLSAIYRR